MIFQMANFKGSKAEGRHGVERAGRGRDFRVVKVVKDTNDLKDFREFREFRDFKGPLDFKGSFDGAPGRGGQ